MRTSVREGGCIGRSRVLGRQKIHDARHDANWCLWGHDLIEIVPAGPKAAAEAEKVGTHLSQEMQGTSESNPRAPSNTEGPTAQLPTSPRPHADQGATASAGGQHRLRPERAARHGIDDWPVQTGHTADGARGVSGAVCEQEHRVTRRALCAVLDGLGVSTRRPCAAQTRGVEPCRGVRVGARWLVLGAPTGRTGLLCRSGLGPSRFRASTIRRIRVRNNGSPACAVGPERKQRPGPADAGEHPRSSERRLGSAETTVRPVLRSGEVRDGPCLGLPAGRLTADRQMRWRSEPWCCRWPNRCARGHQSGGAPSPEVREERVHLGRA